jgi:hypothetical protein
MKVEVCCTLQAHAGRLHKRVRLQKLLQKYFACMGQIEAADANKATNTHTKKTIQTSLLPKLCHVPECHHDRDTGVLEAPAWCPVRQLQILRLELATSAMQL